MVNPPKGCIFCPNGQRSKEHLWSKWTYNILPRLRDQKHIRSATGRSNRALQIQGLIESKVHQGGGNTIKVRAVCRPCNHGWMRELDESVRPILSPLIIGQPSILEREDQRILAGWSAMKMIVSEHLPPSDVITPTEVRRNFKNSNSVLGQWIIMLASQNGDKWRTGLRRVSAAVSLYNEDGTPLYSTDPYVPNFQMVALGIGKLMIFAINCTLEKFEIDHPADRGDLFKRILPFRDQIVWQPPPALTDAEIEGAVSSFQAVLVSKTRNDDGPFDWGISSS